MKLFRNVYYTGKRDWEVETVAYCIAPAPPSSNWEEVRRTPGIETMVLLYRRGDAVFYGWP